MFPGRLKQYNVFLSHFISIRPVGPKHRKHQGRRDTIVRRKSTKQHQTNPTILFYGM